MSAPAIGAALRAAAAALTAAGVPDPGRDARLLMRLALGATGAGLAAAGDRALTGAEIARFDQALRRRCARQPLSHITGEREFWGRSFRVTPEVLDPRPETEIMISAAFEGPAPGRILDLGTGSGCILISLLLEWPRAVGVGVDASAGALKVAAANVARFGLGQRMELRRGDWLCGIAERHDLIVCNPPYIAEDEMVGLSPEVAEHEPTQALTPGGDGLGAYRTIAARLGEVLHRQGRALFEIGSSQGADVRAIFRAAGFNRTKVIPDLDGRDRCVAVSGLENYANLHV